MSEINCPICGNVDAIQKVSTVVFAGTSSGRFSGPSGGLVYAGGKWGTAGGYSSLSGMSTTMLASSLSIEKPGGHAAGLGGCMVLSLPSLLTFLGCTMLEDGGVVAVVIGLGVFIYFMFHMLKEQNRRLKIIEEIWAEAAETWNKLYFCFRDDVVFDPESGACVPRPRMNDLVFPDIDEWVVLR